MAKTTSTLNTITTATRLWGHTTKHCKALYKKAKSPLLLSVEKNSKTSPSIPRNNTPVTYKQVLCSAPAPPTKMEPHLDVGPHMQDIFVPPRDHLARNARFLERTALVVMHRGAPTPAIAPQFSAALAEIHGWEPHHYQVYLTELTPFIVICPGIANRNAVVGDRHRGVYQINEMLKCVSYLETHILAWSLHPLSFKSG